MLGKARIVGIEELKKDFYSLLLQEKRIAGEAAPGQFLHLKIGDRLTPFLRRPFSLAGVTTGEGMFQVIFRVVGEGTRILSKVSPGEEIDCLGPLGHGFRLLPQTGARALLAGGLGAAPLLYLAQILAEAGEQIAFFYGATSSRELLPVEKFLPGGVWFYPVTEDGSAGSKGLVTEAFEREIKKGLMPGEIFACGPRPMLQELSFKNRKWGYPLQISLEERMACGVGACWGCAVEIREAEKTSYRRVCKEGPVFNYEGVVWPDD